MITEDYVSFEVARLLRDKGFDEPCYACYEYFKSSVTLYHGWPFEYKGRTVKNSSDRIKCPTLQMAMKWLRVMHHLFITPFSSSQKSWTFRITTLHQRLKNGVYGEDYETYEEACEAAIKYCLENLIAC